MLLKLSHHVVTEFHKQVSQENKMEASIRHFYVLDSKITEQHFCHTVLAETVTKAYQVQEERHKTLAHDDRVASFKKSMRDGRYDSGHLWKTQYAILINLNFLNK